MSISDDADLLAGSFEALGQDAALPLSGESVATPTTKRPSISAAIARQVLTESGHRCAVCGAESPLERAHIVPWRKVRRHSPANLICLCANCHQRADLENWGEKTLQFYKQNPWVNRSRTRDENLPVQVRLTIDMAITNFDDKAQRLLRHAMAGFLEISPDAIKVVKIEEGSVKITLELSSEAAQKLASAYRSASPSLAESLRPFTLLDVEESLAIAQEQRAEQPSLEEVKSFSVKLGSPLTRAKLAVAVKEAEDSRRRELDAIEKSRDGKVETRSKKIRIRQVRSSIGSQRELQAILRGLGFRRNKHEVEQLDTPEVRAMLDKVRFLIEVSEDN